MAKKTKAQKAKANQPPSIPPTSQEQSPTDLPTPPYDKSSFNETDFPPLPHSPVLTDTNPITGGRREGQDVDETVGATGDLIKGSTAGLKAPGKTDTGGKDDSSSLQIKIHLNLHAKVKLELDAQVYGDIVIGLL